MSLRKIDIVKNINSKAHISLTDSSTFLEHFIRLIKNKKNFKIKISNFGSFFQHQAPTRLGRNPKTKEEFQIPARTKIVFKASNKVKNIIN